MLGKLFQDKLFFQTMFKLSTPIIIQNLITFSLGAVDMLMIGQLGDEAVAAVGLADQIFFLLILMLFGLSSGGAIFVAQYWGKRDMPSIHKVLGLTVLLSLLGSLGFALVALFIPERVLGIYTADTAVIALGSDYLRLVALSYMASAVTVSYTFTLRSIEQVKLPMMVGAIALISNTTMNYALIFGHFGFPQMGVGGAALATCLARILEAIILVSVIYWQKQALAARPGQLLAFEWSFASRFLKTALPVVLTEIAWSLGVTTYAIIYARISTEAIAAVNIVVTIERIAFVVFLGMSNASAIMIGNRIGANEIDKATIYAKRFLVLSVLAAIPMGVLVMLGAGPVLSLYKVSTTVSEYARLLLLVMAFVLPLKVTALMVFIGILRSGGDTRFSLFADAGFIWLVGVPLALIGAFVLELPVYWVYLLVVVDEVCKITAALWRFFSGRWIHRLAEPDVVGVPAK